jgi:hypothetical protein
VSQTQATENERHSFIDGVPQWFGQAAQVGTGVAGFSYGFGWVLATRFYSNFGIDPQDAGVDFAWLAIRSFMVGVAGLAAFLCVRWLLRAAKRGKSSVRVVQSRAAIVGLILVSCLGIAGIVALGLSAWVTETGGDVSGASFAAVLLCGALIAALLLKVRPPAVRLGWNSELWLRGVAGAISGFVVVGLLLLPYQLGGRLASEVRHGEEVHVPIMPGVPVFDIVKVRLIAVSDQPIPPGPLAAINGSGGCVLRLGEHDGTSIYYAHGVVLRISDQNVTATGPC